MAALSGTQLLKRSRLGDRMVEVWQAAVSNTAASDEWIATRLSKLEGVLGWSVIGTAPLGDSSSVPTAPVAATQTVTFIATDPTDADTITVNGVVYTINSTVSTTGAYSVLLDATETTMAANFAAAINRTGTPGTDYSLYVAENPDVSASVASAVVTLTARVPGTVGNALTLAASSTGATVGGATFSGGLDANAAVNVGSNFVLDAQGTGVTAGTNPGDLGVELSSAATIQVTVFGRP